MRIIHGVWLSLLSVCLSLSLWSPVFRPDHVPRSPLRRRRRRPKPLPVSDVPVCFPGISFYSPLLVYFFPCVCFPSFVILFVTRIRKCFVFQCFKHHSYPILCSLSSLLPSFLMVIQLPSFLHFLVTLTNFIFLHLHRLYVSKLFSYLFSCLVLIFL